MKMNFTAVAALLLASVAPAHAADPVCRVPTPRVPQMEWRGQAAYQAVVKVSGGRVVGTDITALYGAVERRAQRAMVMAITEALQKATCQAGEHVFQQRFNFTSGDGGTPAPAISQTLQTTASWPKHPRPPRTTAAWPTPNCPRR
jgi:hypothetical protein